MAERIVLGSGKLYCAEYTGTIPEDTAIEVEGNLLGLIQGVVHSNIQGKFMKPKTI